MKQREKNVVYVDGIRLFGGDRQEGVREIAARLADGRQTAVYTPNPILLENAAKDASFRAVLTRADLNLPDGVGVVVAARLLGEEISERLSGIDMARRVLFLASKKRYRVFFLGGREGVARAAAARMRQSCPGLCVCGARSGYFSSGEVGRVLEEIRRAKPDILFVCLGSPKQECFIDRYRRELPDVKLFMALGGTLDVWAGQTRRAPEGMRRMGLEWAWRMACEPRRLRELPKMAAFSVRILKKHCHSAHKRQTKSSVLKKI